MPFPWPTTIFMSACPASADRPLPLSTIAAVEQINGPVIWLSACTPIHNIQIPSFSQRIQPAQMDRSVNGDREFAHGIGVHSYSRVDFAIDPTCRAFRTQFAIDGDLPWADVTVRIKLDDRVAYEKQHVTAGPTSDVVKLDLAARNCSPSKSITATITTCRIGSTGSSRPYCDILSQPPIHKKGLHAQRRDAGPRHRAFCKTVTEKPVHPARDRDIVHNPRIPQSPIAPALTIYLPARHSLRFSNGAFMFGLRQKLVWGFGGLLAILLLVSGLGIAVLTQYRGALDKFFYENWRSIAYGQNIVDAMQKSDDIASSISGIRGEPTRDQLVAASAAAGAPLAQIDQNVTAEDGNITIRPEEDEIAAKLTTVWNGKTLSGEKTAADNYHDVYARLLDEKTAGAARAEIYFALTALSAQLKTQAHAVINLNLANMKPLDGRAKKMADDATRLVVLLAVAGVLLRCSTSWS